MKILSSWLRSYLPGFTAGDRELAEALTLRGIAVEGIFELGPDKGSLFEMDITTNRVDAMNHYGIAREAAAIYGLSLTPLRGDLPPAAGAAPVEVLIEAPDLCGRFTARALSAIRIQPSTGKVRERFEMLEQKLISNAVDATNYVLMAMGHPTHAFDRDKLQGGLILRRARKGEKLKTLDGIERLLDPEDLVVADERKALALAGVMGGWDTMITPETKNVLVEAAWFDPLSIRRSSKRHGLHTDASHRFERGADFNAPPLASALVSQLLLSAGGSAEGELVDVIVPEAAARTAQRPSISLNRGEVRRILGATEDGGGVDWEKSRGVLESLGCGLRHEGEGAYAVTLPSWRLDLEREIDLIEEIARVYGYDRFANTLPVFSGAVVEPPHRAKELAVRRSLLALGWSEAVSSSFCSATDADTFAREPGTAVAIGNPLNEEAGMLRPSLVPGMLGMLGNNLNRNVNDVQLFEIGTCFSSDHADRVDERPALAMGLAGAGAAGPHLPVHAFDFYDIKGAVEEVLERFSIRSLYFDAEMAPPWLNPRHSARAVADGETVAWFGELAPAQAQQRKLRQTAFVGQVYLDRLYQLPLRQPIARELSRFQPVHRDFSFIFPAAVRWRKIAEALDNLSLAELTRFIPREIFRGAQGRSTAKTAGAVPPAHYSILIAVTFQSLDRTLRDEELQGYSQSIVEALESLGGKQRA